MDQNHVVTVEFYGIPRQRAGRAEVTVSARDVGEMLAEVMYACPGLADLLSSGRISSQVRISLDGQRFLEDLGEKLTTGTRVLILSADVGG